jgi:hypothetical protein
MWDPGGKKFGSGMEKNQIRDLGWKKNRIRDKHPGSATLVTAYSDKESFSINYTLISTQITIGTPCLWRWCPTDRARAPRRR